MAVEARKQVAPKKNTDSCRNDRAEVMGVLSYADSGGGRAGGLLGGAGDRVMIWAMGSFWTASMCACSSSDAGDQVMQWAAAESGRYRYRYSCRISSSFSGPIAAAASTLGWLCSEYDQVVQMHKIRSLQAGTRELSRREAVAPQCARSEAYEKSRRGALLTKQRHVGPFSSPSSISTTPHRGAVSPSGRSLNTVLLIRPSSMQLNSSHSWLYT